ncbi:hypothetical protein BJF90_45060 [Pseudonocardia sp. CNS-004]|nr:hypothetical protein BJF90_45060 [Pseudonocardia sp. CNS-004]
MGPGHVARVVGEPGPDQCEPRRSRGSSATGALHSTSWAAHSRCPAAAAASAAATVRRAGPGRAA